MQTGGVFWHCKKSDNVQGVLEEGGDPEKRTKKVMKKVLTVGAQPYF